jgi:hypothetical protein
VKIAITSLRGGVADEAIQLNRRTMDWVTGNIVLPALRASFARPKSLLAILSLRSQRRRGSFYVASIVIIFINLTECNPHHGAS